MKLAFRKIALQRMPGFPDGGFTLSELSPGINIVYGPNASGKSTTAAAIAALLWPDDAAPDGTRHHPRQLFPRSV